MARKIPTPEEVDATVEQGYFRVPQALTYLYIAALFFCAGAAGIGGYAGLRLDKTLSDVEDLRGERAVDTARTTFENCTRLNRSDRHNREQDETLLDLVNAATDTRRETFSKVATKQRRILRHRIRGRNNDRLTIDRIEPRNCRKLPSQRPFAKSRR